MMSWKKILLCASSLGSSVTWLSAQPATAPAPVSAAPAAAAPVAAPSTGRVFRHILVAESVEAAQLLAPPEVSGFIVLSPGLATFDLAELTRRLADGQGRVIEPNILGAVAQVIEGFFKDAGYATAAAAFPPTQNIAEGHVRIVVNLGAKSAPAAAQPAATAPTAWKIRSIDTKGAKWFSDSLLRSKLQLEQGQLIRFTELEQALNWTNNSPYRRVRVHLEPVPNSTEADVTVTVLDALPLRLAVSIDNTGNEAIGEQRYIASVSYANLWGLDHQVGYQFITTDQARFFQVHNLDYRVPLRWRHYLQFNALYLEAKPEFFGGVLVNKGESINADLRYTIPLRTGDSSLEAFGALGFKQTNNNLLFFGDIAQTTKTDIVQFTGGFSGVRRDKRGAWGYSLAVTASPGGLTPRNTSTAFDAARHGGVDSARLGATASYIYANVSLQRVVALAPGWDLMARGTAQISQANLLASEQFNLGGANSIRGFRENVSAGDNGFAVSGELMAPPLKLALPRLSRTRGPLESRLLAFVDFGDASVRRKLGLASARPALASAGVGLRGSLSYHFSFTADFGWQLSRLAGAPRERGLAHLKATLAF